MGEMYPATGELIGYARVSTRSQSTDTQMDDLKAAGCTKIFCDEGVSGKLADRPEWSRCLDYLRPGDTLVITRLSRAMRSLQHLLEVVNGTKAGNYEDGLKARGINLRVLKQDIDTTTATGRLTFHIMAAFDEFLRELIVEGTNEGLEAARQRGRKGGRKEVLTDEHVRRARDMLNERDGNGDKKYTQAYVAEFFGVSARTLRTYLTPGAAEARRQARRVRYDRDRTAAGS